MLFVCNGNICRSPYAEAAARRALASSSRAPSFGSAGLIGPDRPSPEDAIAAAAERGIDLAAHRSCLVTPELASKAELVLVMNSTQRRRLRGMLQLPARRLMLLGDLDPEPISTRAIPDPERRPIEEFRSCYARIDRCVDTLAEALRASPSVR